MHKLYRTIFSQTPNLYNRGAALSARSLSTVSMWKGFNKEAPPDKILKLTEMFKADENPSKVNLGAGTYRDENNKPWVLPSVHIAASMTRDMDFEYAPIDGSQDFIKVALELVYGPDLSIVKKAGKDIVGVQCLSGTGGLRVIFELLSFMHSQKGDKAPTIYMPSPTWPNHPSVAKRSGCVAATYRYYGAATNSLDFDGLLADLRAMPDGSYVLLHVCAHNPTGIDPSREQWGAISDVMKSKQHVTIFDCAYQGFATGDVDNDSYPIRLFAEQGHSNIMLAQSFAKNFGLYGERIGCVSMLVDDAAQRGVVLSHLKANVIRPMYSSPPLHGARIVSLVLGDPQLRAQWMKDCKIMADRIKAMRTLLRQSIEDLQNNERISSKSWRHMTDQVGMFCYTGMTTEQVMAIRSRFSIYCTEDGRISMAGVNTQNAAYIAKAIYEVSKQ